MCLRRCFACLFVLSLVLVNLSVNALADETKIKLQHEAEELAKREGGLSENSQNWVSIIFSDAANPRTSLPELAGKALDGLGIGHQKNNLSDHGLHRKDLLIRLRIRYFFIEPDKAEYYLDEINKGAAVLQVNGLLKKGWPVTHGKVLLLKKSERCTEEIRAWFRSINDPATSPLWVLAADMTAREMIAEKEKGEAIEAARQQKSEQMRQAFRDAEIEKQRADEAARNIPLLYQIGRVLGAWTIGLIGFALLAVVIGILGPVVGRGFYR